MHDSFRFAVIVAFALGACSEEQGGITPDAGDTDADTDLDTDADVDTDTDSDSDADADGDSDTDTECDTDEMDDSDVNDGCASVAEFPSSNGADGCTRTLLSQIDGLGLEWGSMYPRISRDGSVAVFTLQEYPCSYETDGVPEDTNGVSDVYAVDLSTLKMELVSVSSEGEPGNAESGSEPSAVSADGRYVVFSSSATNLTEDADFGGLFVRDRQLGTTERVSVTYDGNPSAGSNPSMSADGRYVVFLSGDPALAPDGEDGEGWDMYLRDRELGATEILSVANNGDSVEAGSGSMGWISDDGRYVAFSHSAPLSDDDLDSEELSTSKRTDVYVLDRETNLNRLVSVAPDGFSDSRSSTVAFAPDGSWVMFISFNPEHYYDTTGYDNATNTILAHLDSEEITFEPVMAADADFTGQPTETGADGRYVAFWDFGQYTDYIGLNPAGQPLANSYILDRDTGSVVLVSASDDGTPGVVPDYVMDETTMVDFADISISGDGKRSVFTSIEYGLVDSNDYTIPCPNTPHLLYLLDCP